MIEFRGANREESRILAELYSISSDGLATYRWTKLAKPGQDILDVGERCYEKEEGELSYRNCTIVEVDSVIAGMMVAYPIASNHEIDEDPVLAPYGRLELDNSYAIGGVALYPEYRGKGVGHQLIALAKQQAMAKNLDKISLIVFENNQHALNIYKDLGYEEIKREKIIEHPMIDHTGDAILMVKKLDK